MGKFFYWPWSEKNSVFFFIAHFSVAYFLAATFSLGSFCVHAWDVYVALRKKNLKQARQVVGRMVGRHTAALSQRGIIRACVESIAENLSDSLIAPFFYFGIALLLGNSFEFFSPEYWVIGLSMAIFFRHVNLMDSLYGYRNPEFLHFGWASARLDDLCGYVPARLSAVLLIFCASVFSGIIFLGGWLQFFWGKGISAIRKGKKWCSDFRPLAPLPSLPPLAAWKDRPVFSGKQAIRIWLRDRNLHDSPNAGQAEAAMAGGLRIQLGGTNKYFPNRVVHTPVIGGVDTLLTKPNFFLLGSVSVCALHQRHILLALALSSTSFLFFFSLIFFFSF